MPERIQRKRVKGWIKPPGAVYVGRGSKFGNPYDWRHGTDTGNDPRADAVLLFKSWLAKGRGPSAPTDAEIQDLRGKDLMCWCALDQPCHADVLLELANGPAIIPQHRQPEPVRDPYKLGTTQEKT